MYLRNGIMLLNQKHKRALEKSEFGDYVFVLKTCTRRVNISGHVVLFCTLIHSLKMLVIFEFLRSFGSKKALLELRTVLTVQGVLIHFLQKNLQ